MARLIIHPGEHLADELKALGMSANQLAKELGVPTNRITEIIRGKRGISGDTALRLGRWFGTGPDTSALRYTFGSHRFLSSLNNPNLTVSFSLFIRTIDLQTSWLRTSRRFISLMQVYPGNLRNVFAV